MPIYHPSATHRAQWFDVVLGIALIPSAILLLVVGAVVWVVQKARGKP